MKLRYKIVATLLPLLGLLIYVYLLGRRSVPAANHPLSVAVLPPNVSERITVNPQTHKLVIERPGQPNINETLPDRQSTIDITKTGMVMVMSPQYGFELKPFLGLTASDHIRFIGGVDLAYYKRLDLGMGVGSTFSLTNGVVSVILNYNIYDNLRVGILYDSRQHIGAGLTLRI